MRIVLVEDDLPLGRFIIKSLEAESYAVDWATDGQKGLDLALHVDCDLLLLDLGLPKMEGAEILRRLRAAEKSTPVLVLSARTDVQGRVSLLDSGADDYLTKPFSVSELSARVRALLRRGTQASGVLIRVADLEMDRMSRRVTRANKPIELTSKEYALLEYLMCNAGRTVTRSMLVERVWNLSFDTGTNVVDVYINYLRKKLGGESSRPLIHTVRGVGYTIKDSGRSVPNGAENQQEIHSQPLDT